MADVDIWVVRLEEFAPGEAEGWASAEERARARRFEFERHARRYLGSHVALRALLARRLGVGPAELRFRTRERGKPSVEGVCFNLSHAGERAAIAMAPVEVGVDVEEVRPERATRDIARRFFAPAEVEALEALPAEEQVAAFFRVWTRKESYIKATGEGLSADLGAFEVTVGAEARLLATRPDARERERWSMHGLDIGPGYEGAVTVAGRTSVIRVHEVGVRDLVSSSSLERGP